MAHSRLLGVAVMLVSVGSMAAAPAPAPGPSPTPRIQIQPQMTMPSVTITQVAFALGGYQVTVNNPLASTNPMELHYKGKAIPFDSKSKGQVLVSVPDPDSVALCNIGTLAFNLTGTNAELKIRHAEVVGSPAFTASGGKLTGAPVTPGDANGKVALVSGGATHWYGCGYKFEMSALTTNDTTVTPQHLKVELFDIDGSKMGEAPANVGPKDQTSITVGSNGNVSGRVGKIRAHLSDPTSELDGKIMGQRDLLIEITRTGGNVSLKLID
jgi:hypothetical protein